MDSTEDKSPSAEWCPASWHLVHLDRRRNHLHEAVSWQKRELCTVFIDWTNPKWWALNIPVTSLGRARLAPPPSAFLVDSDWLVDIQLLDYVSYMFFFPLTCFSSPYLISYHNMQPACNRNSKVKKIMVLKNSSRNLATTCYKFSHLWLISGNSLKSPSRWDRFCFRLN
jgi:hypothetical protein